MNRTIYAGVSIAALCLMAPASFAQTAVNQGTSGSPILNGATVTVGGSEAVLSGATTLATGASLSIGATGAAGQTSVTGVGAAFALPVGGFGNVDQFTSNTAAITTGDKATNASITFGASPTLSGNGASASISGSGSSVGFGVSNIGGSNATAVTVDGLATQSAKNSGAVTTFGTIGDSTNTPSVTGKGASVGISASGASAGFSLASIGGTFGGATNTGATNGINQTVENSGAIINNSGGVTGQGKVTVGAVSGDAASVSVSARGSSASVAITSINATTTSTKIGDLGVVQGSENKAGGTVTNYGNITAGGLGGIATSAGVSASGSVASFSVEVVPLVRTESPLG